jgi:hypothetical protein
MTMSDSALPLRAALTGDMPSDVASHVASHVASDVQLTFDDRHWRIRGLEKQLSGERLRVNLLVTRQDLTQRLRTTRRGRPAIVATLDDVAVANRLLSQTLAARPDHLLPQTRLLLSQLEAWVTQAAAEQQLARPEVRFTQRQLRDRLGWPDRALRRQLTRLVELEYVLVYRTGCGNGRVYQLLYASQPDAAPAWQLGLRDVEALSPARRRAARGGAVQASPSVVMRR